MAEKIGMVAQVALRKLLEETNHLLSLEDFDDISALNEIGLKISNPDLDAEWDVLCLPVRAGGILLWEPTLGAILWIQERLIPWFEKQPFILDIGIAYALSQNDRLEELWVSSERADALKQIKKWWRHARCSYLQLERALDKLLPEPKPDIASEETNPKGDLTYGPLIALLIREFGKDRNYWLWDAPLSEIEGLQHDYERRIEAEAAATRKAAARSGQAIPPFPSPKFYKIRQFRKIVNKLREKWLTMSKSE